MATEELQAAWQALKESNKDAIMALNTKDLGIETGEDLAVWLDERDRRTAISDLVKHTGRSEVHVLRNYRSLLNAFYKSASVRASGDGQTLQRQVVEENIYTVPLADTSSYDQASKVRELLGVDSEGNAREGVSPLLLFFRPGTVAAPWPPIQLVHPVFGNFLENAHSLDQVCAADVDAVVQLCHVASGLYDSEELRLEQQLPILADLVVEALGYSAELAAVDLRLPAGTRPAFVIRDEGMQTVWVFGEGMNEVGQGAVDSCLQGIMAYYRYWRSLKDTAEHERTCCPALLVEIVGPLLRISGLAFTQRPICQPLTPFLHLYHMRQHDKQHMNALVSTMAAFRIALGELADSYDQVAANTTQANASLLRGSRWGLSDEQLALPYPLQDSSLEVKRIDLSTGGKRLLYEVKRPDESRPRVVKFTQQYHKDVHAAWAAAGCAPDLYDVVSLPGGFYQVEMEALSSDEGWATLSSVLQTNGESAYECAMAYAIAALKRAHSTPIRAGVFAVHGDARDDNVMVRECGDGSYEVRFVDFDWAGCEGEDSPSRYPLFMNPSIEWPKPVNERAIMDRADDTQLLQSCRRRQGVPPTRATSGGRQARLAVRGPRHTRLAMLSKCRIFSAVV